MTTVQPRSVKDTLSATESGGNPNAWRRNQDGREFVGQWQFGEARLRDLGLGVNFTMDQFRNDPELQSRVMDMHVADINKFIDNNGLNVFEGRTVGGVPITRSGMIAMAHLGGQGGLQKFLESGGEYNPADELGTSLSDYALKHGGPMVANTPQATGERLRTFAADADGRALDIRSVTEEVVGEALGRDPRIRNAMAGPVQGPPGPGLPLAMSMGQMPMAPATQLGWGSAVPEGASPFAANGMPEPIADPRAMGNSPLSFGRPSPMQGMPNPSGVPSNFTINPQATPGAAGDAGGYSAGSPVVSTSGGGAGEEAATEEDPERNGFLTRIGRAIFGESEEGDDAPDQKFKTLLGGIGVGLGQMSAGQPVDLQPYFANIAANKQAAIDSYQQAQQDAIDNEIAYMNADTQRANAEVAFARLQQDIAQAAKDGVPYNPGLSPETIQKYGNMPKFAPFMEILASPDASDEAKETAMQGFKQSILDEATGASANPQGVADVYQAFQSGDPEQIAAAIAANPMGVEDLKRLADITDPGMLRKNAEYLASTGADPEVVSHMLKLSRMAGGLSEDQFARDNYAAGREYYGGLLRQVGQGRSLAFNVNTMRQKALQQAAEGKPVAGFQEEWIAPFLAASRRVLPSDWQNKLEEQVGLNPEEFQQLNGLAKFIVLEAARPLMEGQGTVTDQERIALAQSMTDPGMEFEAQMAVLDRLAVLGDVDVALANYYRNNQAGNFHENFQDLQADIELETGAALPQLYASREAWTAYRNANKSRVYSEEFMDADGNMLPKEVIYAKLAPQLSPKQYQMFGSQLVTEGLWFNTETQQYMKGNEVIDLTE